MTDEKQIEEMAKTYCHNPYSCYGYDCLVSSPCTVKEVCKELYKQNYRKILEGSVVLTKEEFDKLGLVIETVQEYTTENGQPLLVSEKKIVKKLQTDFSELLNQAIRELQLAQVRKETAREIIREIKAFIYDNDNLTERLDIIAKQYGVEIEE